MNKGIDVEIIKDSTNWTGKRLTTFILKYPRYIHSELLTHRVFSKNSSSSRAIPIFKMIDNIKEDPVIPIWTLNQKGMQGSEIEDKYTLISANMNWHIFLKRSIENAEFLSNLGIHKQNVNRLLEPWMHIKVILTGTDFDNWFELRNHPDAQPEIQVLAGKMLKAIESSIPQYLQPDEWHIPFDGKYNDGELAMEALIRATNGFGGDREWKDAILDLKLRISVANCARISFNNVDGSTSSLEKDLELFDKLITSKPLHASPAEHQARVPIIDEYNQGFMSIKHEALLNMKETGEKYVLITKKGKYFSNFQGWIQLRKVIEEQIKNK